MMRALDSEELRRGWRATRPGGTGPMQVLLADGQVLTYDRSDVSVWSGCGRDVVVGYRPVDRYGDMDWSRLLELADGVTEFRLEPNGVRAFCYQGLPVQVGPVKVDPDGDARRHILLWWPDGRAYGVCEWWPVIDRVPLLPRSFGNLPDTILDVISLELP